MDYQNIRNAVLNFINNFNHELNHFYNNFIDRCYAQLIITNFINDLDININQNHNFINLAEIVINISNLRINELEREVNRFNNIVDNNNYWIEFSNNIRNFIREIKIITGLYLINRAMINVPNEVIDNMLNQIHVQIN